MNEMIINDTLLIFNFFIFKKEDTINPKDGDQLYSILPLPSPFYIILIE